MQYGHGEEVIRSAYANAMNSLLNQRRRALHNLLRSPNTALRSTLASPKQIGWQADLAQAARGNATRNPAFALFDMSWSLRADTPERLCQGNGTV